MILFINVLLTHKRLSRFDRGLLPTDDPLSVFRFMLASLEDIRFSRVQVFAELDPDDYGPADAALLRADVERTFGTGPAVDFRDRRLDRLDAWRDCLRRTLLPAGECVFYSGNHDHVFVDRDTAVLDACVRRLEALRASHGQAGLIYTQWQEFFSYRARALAWERDCFVQTSPYRDAVQVLTPELLEQWFFRDSTHMPADTRVRRTEDLGWNSGRHYPQVVPHRELFRHYDASSHVGMRIGRCPPLRIPEGFFADRFRLACFRNRDLQSLRNARAQGYTCVGPFFPENAAVSPDGADHPWMLADVPAFLARRAREVLSVGSADAAEEIYQRDLRVAETLDDVMPLTPATLARLAPPAVRGVYDGVDPLPARRRVPAARRRESLGVLKTPLQPRPCCLLVVDWERHYGLKAPAFAPFLRQTDRSVCSRIYVFLAERQQSAWHAPASAVHLVGELYDELDGIAVQAFDFHPDKAAALREVLALAAAERVAILEPGLPGLEGLPAARFNAAMARPGIGCLALVLAAGGRHHPLATVVRSDWLRALFEARPDLFCNENFSLARLVADHFRLRNRCDEEIVDADGIAVADSPVLVPLPPVAVASAKPAGEAPCPAEWAVVEVAVGGEKRPFHFRRDSRADATVIEQILRSRDYDLGRLRRGEALAAVYRRMLERGRAPLIVDAGANIGAAAVWFAGTFPGARVAAVEPAADNLRLLERNVAGLPGVRVFANALAAREGTLVLEDPLLGEWGYRTAEAGQGTVVPAVTMARLFACFPEADPFIVKIDIEGGEAPLFETGADWLDRTPLVIIELHDWMLPGSASSRSFLRAVASRNRDFVHLGENVYSIHNGLV